ncbi:MAG TPA: NAD-binding protein [Chloroflexota bacterium]
MYIIVAGAGKVGYYLTKELVAQGHEVLVIEKDRKKCERIADELGNVVLRGDACEVSVLAEAGTSRADVVAAVTGDDEDNLVICQVAKRRFNAKRTIARINNPKNEEIFRLLGIDATVSSTEVILAVIEQEIPAHALVPLLRLRHADVELVETVLGPGSRVVGKELRQVDLPPHATIALIIRDGQPIFPTGSTRFQVGDEVLALTNTENEEWLRALLVGSDVEV